MKEFAARVGNGLMFKKGHEKLWIVPWGVNGLRVRVTQQAEFLDLPQALLDKPDKPAKPRKSAKGKSKVTIGEKTAELVNGLIKVEVSKGGNVTFIRASDGATLLKECVKNTNEYLGRTFIPY